MVRNYFPNVIITELMDTSIDFSWKDLQMHCNCLPTCQFSRYEVHSDVANLDATHTMSNTNDGFL